MKKILLTVLIFIGILGLGYGNESIDLDRFDNSIEVGDISAMNLKGTDIRKAVQFNNDGQSIIYLGLNYINVAYYIPISFDGDYTSMNSFRDALLKGSEWIRIAREKNIVLSKKIPVAHDDKVVIASDSSDPEKILIGCIYNPESSNGFLGFQFDGLAFLIKEEKIQGIVNLLDVIETMEQLEKAIEDKRISDEIFQ